MSSFEIFNRLAGLLVVPVRLTGPTGETRVRLALDTGATGTMVRAASLELVGYNLDAQTDRPSITTVSGVERAPRLRVQKIEALGVERVEFPVVAHTLPPTSTVDGLLGLDFFRGLVLTLDFREGRITLE